MVTQRHGHLHRELRLQASSLVDRGELAELFAWHLLQLPLLQVNVCLLGVPLRAHRDELTRRHRHRARHEPGQTRQEHLRMGGRGGGHSDHQARRGHDAIIGPEHRGAQPGCT